MVKIFALIALLVWLSPMVGEPAPVSPDITKQLNAINEMQSRLVAEHKRLEDVKVTLKYRACLEAKYDAATCDASELVPDAVGYSLRRIEKEKK